MITKSFWCAICEERVEHEVAEDVVELGVVAAMEHFRLYHPDEYESMERWPDGAPVIVYRDPEVVDFEEEEHGEDLG